VASRLTPNERARRYLESARTAGNPKLPSASRQAARSVMRGHEAAYPDVRKHAIAGDYRKHFDKTLGPSERSQQQRLRRREHLTESQLTQHRRELEDARTERRAEQRAEQLAGPRAAAGAATAAGGAISQVTGGGNTFLYFIGVLLVLSLVYLLVAGKGVNALTGLTGVVTGGVRAFVAPVDPIQALEHSLGAGPISPAAGAVSSASAPGGPAPGTTTPHQSAPSSWAAPMRGKPAPTPGRAAKGVALLNRQAKKIAAYQHHPLSQRQFTALEKVLASEGRL
jgi:hypothetical protein